ncbi:MAG: glycosyltransferase, partial [Xanthomonadales bacterium]|nr:glycosyltransferase [Xanthomonadales bacterium]
EAVRSLPTDVYALVIGRGSNNAVERTRQAAQHAGVGDRLIIAPQVDRIQDVMAISDVVLSLSTKAESFGRTVAEALALGRPVIGYDHGGVGEILARLYPQGRVPVGDGRILVERIRSFLADPPHVPDEQPFLKSRMQAETLRVYRELTEQTTCPEKP